MRTTWDTPARRGLGLLAAALVILVGVLALGVVAPPLVGKSLHSGDIYPGVQVLGVDVGSQTVDQATTTLGVKLVAYERTPITLAVGDKTLTMQAGQLGFHPQAADLAQLAYSNGRDQGAIGFISRTISGKVLGSVGVPDSALVDQQAVDSAVAQIATESDRQPVDASLTLNPQIELKPSAAGQSLDQAAARQAIAAYLVAMRTEPLSLPTRTLQPKVTTAQLQPIQSQAAAIVQRAMTLTDGSQTWAVPKGVLQGALVLKTGPYALDVQSSAFSPLVAQVAGQVNRQPTDASLAIAGGKVTLTPDVPGQAVDQPATVASIRNRILAGSSSASLIVNPVQAKLRATDLQATANDTNAAIAKGLVVSVSGDGAAVPFSYTLTASELGGLLQISQATDGSYAVGVKNDQIASLVSRLNGQYQYPGLTARPVTWSNGRVSIRNRTVSAVVIDQPKAVATIAANWRKGQVTLPTTTGQMTIDQSFVNRLNADLKGIIQQRSISFAGSISQRAHNISLALSRLNGTLIAPGETFSFNTAVGPTTLANGYQWGFGYTTGANGQSTVVPSEGGGICEVATTVFQPVFWAGYEIEQRNWHMFPMPHYAMPGYIGLDATVDPPYVDLQFKNTTDHYLMLDTGTRGSSTYVALVTTKPDWKVSVTPEQLSDRKPALTNVVRSTSPAFRTGQTIYVETAQEGFTSRITRTVTTPDGKVRTLNLKSVYQPSALSIVTGTG